MKEGVHKMTLYDILKVYENNLPAIRQSGSERTAKIFTPKKINQLKRDFITKIEFRNFCDKQRKSTIVPSRWLIMSLRKQRWIVESHSSTN